MASVWVVETGEYSDYRVVGVFSSKENAQQIADTLHASYDEATVSEWPLDPAVLELRQGFTRFLVDMRVDGTIERCDRSEPNAYNIAGSVSMWRRTQAPAYRGNPDKPDVLQVETWARDEQHAIKITNEHRIRFIASGEWTGNL